MDRYLQEAIKEYEYNIKNGHNFFMDASTLMDIEEYYEKNGRNYDAEQLMRFAEKLHPDSPDVLIVKAYRLKNAGQWNKAIEVLGDIHDLNTHDVQTFLAEWEVASGYTQKALERISRFIEKNAEADTDALHVDLAEIFLDYGFARLAIDCLKNISDGSYMTAKADDLRAFAFYQQGDYEKSLEYYTRYVDATPYESTAWSQLADMQTKLERYDDCITSCDYALTLDSSNRQAMELKLFATLKLHRPKEGAKLYTEYVSQIPDDYSIHMYIGEQFISSGFFAEAEKVLHEALRLCPIDSPDRPRIIQDTACCMCRLNRPEECRELMVSQMITGLTANETNMQLAETYFATELPHEGVKALTEFLHNAENEKDYLQAARLLFNHEVFKPADDLWHSLTCKNLTDIDSYPVYAYSAYALYAMRDKKNITGILCKSAICCPQYLCYVFLEKYNTLNVQNVIDAVIQESSAWKD